MAKTSSIQIRIKYVGDGEDRDVYVSANNANAPLGISVAGVQGVNGPYGAASSPNTFEGAIYLPPVSLSGIPSASQVPKQLISADADVGIPLYPAGPHVLPQTSMKFFLTAPEQIVLKGF